MFSGVSKIPSLIIIFLCFFIIGNTAGVNSISLVESDHFIVQSSQNSQFRLSDNYTYYTEYYTYVDDSLAADIDNDGFDEIITAGNFHRTSNPSCRAQLRMYNITNGLVTLENELIWDVNGSETMLECVLVEDFDNDSDLEILTAEFYDQGNYVYHGMIRLWEFLHGELVQTAVVTVTPSNGREQVHFARLLWGNIDEIPGNDLVVIGSEYNNFDMDYPMIQAYHLNETGFFLLNSRTWSITTEASYNKYDGILIQSDSDTSLELITLDNSYDEHIANYRVWDFQDSWQLKMLYTFPQKVEYQRCPHRHGGDLLKIHSSATAPYLVSIPNYYNKSGSYGYLEIRHSNLTLISNSSLSNYTYQSCSIQDIDGDSVEEIIVLGYNDVNKTAMISVFHLDNENHIQLLEYHDWTYPGAETFRSRFILYGKFNQENNN